MQQNTQEWYDARGGKITSSQFFNLAGSRLGDGARTYARKLIGERLAKAPEVGAGGKNFDYGHATEPLAINAYEQKTWRKVTPCGFILAPGYDDVGGSPDGLVDVTGIEAEDGIIEVKAKMIFESHVKILLEQTVPSIHIPQIQGNLMATGRGWCDFISYCPEMGKHALIILRVDRDEAYIAKLKYNINAFRTMLAQMETKIPTN